MPLTYSDKFAKKKRWHDDKTKLVSVTGASGIALGIGIGFVAAVLLHYFKLQPFYSDTVEAE